MGGDIALCQAGDIIFSHSARYLSEISNGCVRHTAEQRGSPSMKFREVRKAVQLISGTTIESNPKLADLAWPGAPKRLALPLV